MATLAQSAITVNDIWKGLGTSSRKFLFKDVTLTLTGQGGLTNTILASTLGFTKIVGVEDARDSNSALVDVAPNYTGTGLVLYQASYPVLKSAIVTGVNGAANITVTGIAATDTIVLVQDIGGAAAWVVPVSKTLSHYTIGSADTVAQASGAGDTSAKKLLVVWASPAQIAFGTPTDVTGTVRLTVFGYDS